MAKFNENEKPEMESGSRSAAAAAVICAVSADMEAEKKIIQAEAQNGIRVAAANFGGEFITSVSKIVERALVVARRENIISESHHEIGAVAGATREALSQVMNKAIGLNVGGKISVARNGDHIAVAIFFGIGLMNLNEVGIGLGHRAI